MKAVTAIGDVTVPISSTEKGEVQAADKMLGEAKLALANADIGVALAEQARAAARQRVVELHNAFASKVAVIGEAHGIPRDEQVKWVFDGNDFRKGRSQ